MMEAVTNPLFLKNVFETMRDGMMIVDRDGRIIFFNRAAEEITGYHRDDVMGKECTILDSDTCTVHTEEGRKKNCTLFSLGRINNKKCRIRSNDIHSPGGAHGLCQIRYRAKTHIPGALIIGPLPNTYQSVVWTLNMVGRD